MSRHRISMHVLALTIGSGLLLSLPASSQQGKGPKTQLWMDVATHTMAGMPEMGGMGRAAMGMFGGDAMQNHYGATRYSAMPGRYVDIALLNQLNPGVAAEDLVPSGLQLGKNLPLLPPKAEPRSEDPSQYKPDKMHDAKARILVYWGCGTSIRPGQPREIRIDVKDGQVKASGAMQGRYVPDRTVNVGPSYALWPNERNRKSVPQGASLVGAHQITGDKVPESLKFTLEQAQDFMPAIALNSSGDLDSGLTWTWRSVDRSRGYFLHAMGMQGDAMVFWSSSETPDAGMGILDYLPNATVEKWVKEKVVLAPGTTSCAIPKGIFATPGSREDASGGMMRMIAFGPESNIAWPPKPADPKVAWQPEWNVRVRTKSTTTAMLGMDIAAAAAEEADDEQPSTEKKPPIKSLLRGLLGR